MSSIRPPKSRVTLTNPTELCTLKKARTERLSSYRPDHESISTGIFQFKSNSRVRQQEDGTNWICFLGAASGHVFLIVGCNAPCIWTRRASRPRQIAAGLPPRNDFNEAGKRGIGFVGYQRKADDRSTRWKYAERGYR